jgi:hypothetical protein
MSKKNPSAYQTGDSPFDLMVQRQTEQLDAARRDIVRLREVILAAIVLQSDGQPPEARKVLENEAKSWTP